MSSVRKATDTIRAVLHDRSELSLSELYSALGEADELIRLAQALTERLWHHVEALTTAGALRVDEVGEPADPASLVDGAVATRRRPPPRPDWSPSM